MLGACPLLTLVATVGSQLRAPQLDLVLVGTVVICTALVAESEALDRQ